MSKSTLLKIDPEERAEYNMKARTWRIKILIEFTCLGVFSGSVFALLAWLFMRPDHVVAWKLWACFVTFFLIAFLPGLAQIIRSYGAMDDIEMPKRINHQDTKQ